MARPKNKIPSKSMTLTVPAPLFDFLEEIHWTLRKDRAVMVADIIADWAADNGYVPPAVDDGKAAK